MILVLWVEKDITFFLNQSDVLLFQMGIESSTLETSEKTSSPSTPKRISSIPKSSLTSSSSLSDISKYSRRRLGSRDSLDETNNWGLFIDLETSAGGGGGGNGEFSDNCDGMNLDDLPLRRSLSLPAPASAPPMYVLESSLDTQHLWYSTAGQRPKQPEHERRYFERLWSKNFLESQVPHSQDFSQYDSSNINSNCDPKSCGGGAVDKVPVAEFDCEVLYRGRAPFSKLVSKSFVGHELATLTLQVFKLVNSQHDDSDLMLCCVVVLCCVVCHSCLDIAS